MTMLYWPRIMLLITIIQIISLSYATQHQEFHCIHDEVAEVSPQKVNLASAIQNKGVNKRQASADYSNIRIHTKFVDGTSSVYSQVRSLNSPFSNAIKTLSSVLMVRPVQGNLVIPPMCNEYTDGRNEGKCRRPLPSQSDFKCGEYGVIPPEYIGTREVCRNSRNPSNCVEEGPNGAGIPDTDYILFVSAVTTRTCTGGLPVFFSRNDILAYASTCLLDVNDNNRPIAGFINICPRAISRYTTTILYGLFMHETIHALGFSSRLFDQYMYENGTKYNPLKLQNGPYGREYVFTGPKTAELAKKYYACDDVDGILLEGEGGSSTASSHWEQRTLHHALMNGYVYNDYVVLSQFTIALLEDSGWYKGNYTALDKLNQLPLEWGKGLGCSFLNQRCTNKTIYPYLCDVTTEQEICTYDHLSKGRCERSWRGFNGCPVAVADDNSDFCRYNEHSSFHPDIQRYGGNGICVDTATSHSVSCGTYIISPSPTCVLQTTYALNSSSKYVLWLQNEAYVCEDDSALLTDSDVIVVCPSLDDVFSRTSPVSSELPRLSSVLTFELHNSIYEGNYTNATATNLVAFGELNFYKSMHTDVSYYVNSFVNDRSSVCHLFGCPTCTAPVKVFKDTTVTLSGANIYTVKRDEVTASVMINDTKTQSQDYNLVLMLDPQANHSFVYYAAAIEFMGDYLQSVHSNDESFLAVTALAEDTVIRIAPSQTLHTNDAIVLNNSIIVITVIQSGSTPNIVDTVISYGEEYKMILNLGETWMISSREDITGTRVTANKAVSLYSGHYCASGKSADCTLLTEQIPPYNSWGSNFILHTNISGLNGNMIKIIASDVGANVYMNCTTDGDNYETFTFNLGFRQHTVIPVTHDYCTVNADENILIFQFKDSSGLIQDTFMTILPALSHFQIRYVFNTYPNFDSYVVMTLKNIDPNTDSLLLNKSPVTLKWKSIEISGDIYYYGTLSLSARRYTLEFSKCNIKFGAVIYGIGKNDVDTYALPAGLALHVKNDLPFQGPSPVQDPLVTLVSGELINITWSPPANPNGIIHQYIIKRINSSGTFYYHVSADQQHIVLPYYNDALVFVSAVNLFAQSSYEHAKPKASCLPSPCINNGTCIAVNATDQLQCNCTEMYFGIFCEKIDKLYPFGPLQGDEAFEISRYLRYRSPKIRLDTKFFFYDEIVNIIYVYENGVLSFKREPFDFFSIDFYQFAFSQSIAPFYANVDITGTGNVFYRQTTDISLLTRATNEIQSTFLASTNISIKNLLIVTWNDVGYYQNHTDKVNTFQCVLAMNEFESFVFFLYNDGGIQWTTGDDSGGTNGLGGNEAIVGISSGSYFSNFNILIPFSLSPNILHIDKTSNVAIPGVWMFKVGTVKVAVDTSPLGVPTGGSINNSFIHALGSSIMLTCSISSIPAANSVFKWSCSTGCLVGVEMEQTISVTLQISGEIFCAYTIDGAEYYSDPLEIIVTDFMISSSILFERKRHRVGQEQAINCTATLISTAEHSVIFNWVTPDGVNIDDERITILPTTINENNHTSVLQFEYQMESDNGTYKCEIMSNNTTTSASRELQDLYVPYPRVYLIAPAVQYFGEPLTLTCEVTTSRGITSGVTIIWSTHGNGQRRIVENVNGSIINNTVVYRDLYHIPRLTTEDYFSCRGIINSIPRRSDTDFIILRAISPANCSSYQFKCQITNECIPRNWICDGDEDCSDASDEQNCTVAPTEVNATLCNSGQFYCGADSTNRQCIFNSWVCDGDRDCSNGADEADCAPANCSLFQFKCQITNECIPRNWICDGDEDCIDGSDERNCNGSSGSGSDDDDEVGDCPDESYFCNSSAKCILESSLCDRINDCGDWEDELQSECGDVLLVFPSISFERELHIVGLQQAINCTATLTSMTEEYVNFTWITPDGVDIDDDRVTILPTTVNGNDHTSVIKFEYLMQSDVGTYKCDIMLNNYTTSVSGELKFLLYPSPRANLTAPAVQNFGEPLTLTCEVTTLRGITSGVTIEWSTYGQGERRRAVNVTGSVVNNTVVYRDLYHIPRLTTEGFVQCQGIINTIPIPGPYNIDTIRLILTSPNAAPTKFRFINKTSSTITFQWNRVRLDQVDDKITWYVITCSSLQEKNNVTVNITRRFVQGTITNLTALTTYNCSVHAVTKFGGPKSNFVTVRTDEAALSPVQNAIVTLIDAETINVTWSPSVTVTDIVHQYIIQRTNSSGKFHYHVSANQQHIVLPYYNDALVFVSAVYLFGVSDFEQAQPSESCLPSPCINNGMCFAVNGTDQIQCRCREMYYGPFCEYTNNLYPFGPLQDDELLHNYESSPVIMLDELFFFYDKAVNSVYVNKKGVISFENFQIVITPSPLHFSLLQMIAPFWADVDTRGTGNVYYRQTNDPNLLARATNEIKSVFLTSSNITIRNLLIVTWDAVGYYSQHTDKVNTFQCVLATNELESFVFFLYNDGGIQWTTGDDSGGINGLGGDKAIAGISNGDGYNFTVIPESGSLCVLNVGTASNVGIPGVWMFKVGTVENTAPKNFRNISSTCAAITFQWDSLLQHDDMTSWYVIACSSLKEATAVTANITSSDQTGTVTGLSPSTDYNCTVSTVMKHSELKSHSITVKTAKADKPCNVTRDLKVRGKKATVTFSSEDPKATFKCRLDNKRFKPCTSRIIYRSLSKGQHRITVVARCPCSEADVRHFKFQIP